MAVPAGGIWIGVKNETLGAGTLMLSGGMREITVIRHFGEYSR